MTILGMPYSPTGAFEITLLGIAVVIGLVQLFWASAAAQPHRGLEWNVGPRDEPVPLPGKAGRLQRASANYRETFPMFAAALIGAYLLGDISPLTAWGSLLYVAARAVYVPLYAFGVSYVRSLVWVVSIIGIIMILVALFT